MKQLIFLKVFQLVQLLHALTRRLLLTIPFEALLGWIRKQSVRIVRSPSRITCLVLTITILWAWSSILRYVENVDTSLSVSKWETVMTALEHANKPVGCVSWRATQQCSPYGVRSPSEDTSCRNTVAYTSGYCECANSVVVALAGCGMHSFTCFDRCRELGGDGIRLPRPMSCHAHEGRRPLESDVSAKVKNGAPANGTASATRHWPLELSGAPQLGSDDVGTWEALLAPVRAHRLKAAGTLPKRTEDDDWLREGGRMPASMVANLRQSVSSYIKQISEPDAITIPAVQRGRGIVMVSGGLHFMVSAWISLEMLRRTGSTLPVEMWFPVLEYPTAAVVTALRDRGVICRTFSVPDLDQTGYSLKVAAILLSNFAEILFLDADNFPLQDPEVLFKTPEYLRTGSTFWRDFWSPTAVPEISTILGVYPKDLPNSTFETGQMLIDKRRHWRGLRVALYFNYYRDVFYDLFTDYMGWGDKETFYYAFLAAHEPTFYIPHATGAVGIIRPFCRKYKSRMLCRDIFTGNSMIQYDANRRPMFLHSNLNKWSLQLPDSFADYTRRWQSMQPEAVGFLAWSQAELGLDLERFAYDQARSFRCAPFFEEFYEVRQRHGDHPIPPLEGLHPIVPGIEFHQMYRLGHGGTYYNLFERSLLDDVLFSIGAASRKTVMHIKRVLRHVWGGKAVAHVLTVTERRLRRVLLTYTM